jgi:hypothetical protein
MSKAEKFLQLQEELSVYQKLMSEASSVILDQEVTKYPIFVAHQQEVEIGIPIAERGKVAGNWSIHASSLEEFVSKNIVFPEKIEEFKQNFKDPEMYACVFVLSELGAQFIYLPVKG